MGRQGDFVQLLREQGYILEAGTHEASQNQAESEQPVTKATTVLALKYRDGVMVGGDRRATAGMTVMYDRTDKVLELDQYCVLAIAGVPATAFEMARVLEHSFKYYRRSQLQDLSFDGKLRALSKLLKENAPAALSGTGPVAPIFAGYDQGRLCGKIYFYDILGAEFEGVEYAVSGSGSPTIRGILHYLNQWWEQDVFDLPEEEAVVLVLRLLVTAAEFDSATGGVNLQANLYPIIKRITEKGVENVPMDRIKGLFHGKVAQHV